MAGTVSKNKDGYGYKYSDLAKIQGYVIDNGMNYKQFIDRLEGDDYIMTIIIDKDGHEQPPLRGCRVVQATLNGGKSNPAQEQGSALTYARRYSLLMAFGLATDDDDGETLTKKKEEKKAPAKKAPEPVQEQLPWDIPADIIEPEEAKYLEELIVTAPGQDTPEVRIQKVCAYYNVNSLYDLRPDQAAKLRKQLGGKA